MGGGEDGAPRSPLAGSAGRRRPGGGASRRRSLRPAAATRPAPAGSARRRLQAGASTPPRPGCPPEPGHDCSRAGRMASFPAPGPAIGRRLGPTGPLPPSRFSRRPAAPRPSRPNRPRPRRGAGRSPPGPSLRHGDSTPLAAGGLLGGSQAGARLAYRLNGDSGAAARPVRPPLRPAPAPGRRGGGPRPRLATVAATSGPPPRRAAAGARAGRPLRLRPSPFTAGSATLRLGPLPDRRLRARPESSAPAPATRSPTAPCACRCRWATAIRLGAGAWAAAQPGLARLDLGPQAALRLPVAGRAVTVAADWRLRVAGNARPGSGPTVTLGTDF